MITESDHTMTLPPLPEPCAWMSTESACRLINGGNAKGAVPVHQHRSHTSTRPLFTQHQMEAYAAAAVAAEREANAKLCDPLPITCQNIGGGPYTVFEQPQNCAEAIRSRGGGVMSPKAIAFISALESLCREHGVVLSTSGYDGLQVWDADEHSKPLHCDGIEDCTKQAGGSLPAHPYG